MSEIILNGPDGRIEGRYHHSKQNGAPLALIMHPHPQHGGTMNNKVVFSIYQNFIRRGFSTMRFNFRGVGRSQGEFDNGQGELSDAAAALDWMQTNNPNSQVCWTAGFSFGAWISMQLMMRRPEITGFISVAPPASTNDFTFLAPCPASGLIVHGSDDEVIPVGSVDKLAQKLSSQKNIVIDYRVVEGCNHFFNKHQQELSDHIDDYLEKTLTVAA